MRQRIHLAQKASHIGNPFETPLTKALEIEARRRPINTAAASY
jgi:hypothetical protein